jgi:PHP family Zn ribbon phosphoesterase
VTIRHGLAALAFVLGTCFVKPANAGAPSPASSPPPSVDALIAEALDKTPESQGVWDLYFHFIREFGDEHAILTEVPVSELARVSPEKVAEAVDRMRKGQVSIVPGHDGEYGQIHIFGEGPATDPSASQLSLF